MPLALLALLAALAAPPALAQAPLEPSGRLPPVTSPPHSPERATPVELPSTTPTSRGAVLEQVTGTVKEVDRKEHRMVVESSGGGRITLSLDRNTMVYTSSGLGTVLDVVPGAQIRAGRNADMVAYWVQLRPSAPPQGQAPAPGPGAAPGSATPPVSGAASPGPEPEAAGSSRPRT